MTTFPRLSIKPHFLPFFTGARPSEKSPALSKEAGLMTWAPAKST
jgi:hypothetical protein